MPSAIDQLVGNTQTQQTSNLGVSGKKSAIDALISSVAPTVTQQPIIQKPVFPGYTTSSGTKLQMSGAGTTNGLIIDPKLAQERFGGQKFTMPSSQPIRTSQMPPIQQSSRLDPDLQQMVNRIESKPTQTKESGGNFIENNFLTRALDKASKNLAFGIIDTAQKLRTFGQVANDPNASVIDKVSAGAKYGVSAVGVGFAPVAAPFMVGSQIEGKAGAPFRAVDKGFEYLGTAGRTVIGTPIKLVVNALPLSEQEKANVNSAIDDISGLVGQLAGAHFTIKAGQKVWKAAPEVVARLTKDIATEYNLPRTVTIDGAKVRSIFQTGDKISATELQMVKDLGLDAQGYKNAIRNGLKIEVPIEKITTITDKPYWAKLKNTLGVGEQKSVLQVETQGKPQQLPAGFLPRPGETSTSRVAPTVPEIQTPSKPQAFIPRPIQPQVVEPKIQPKTVDYQGQKVPIIGTIDSKTGNIQYDAKSKTSDLTLKPSEAKTGEERIEETTKVFGIERTIGLRTEGKKGFDIVKPLMDKGDIKTIIESSPEFQANPIMTVDAETNLIYDGKTITFKIKPEALGLNPEKLTIGDKITVDTKALKAKGTQKQMRVFRGGEAYASSGAQPLGKFEVAGTGEKVENFKIFEKVKGLIDKYADRIAEGHTGRGHLGEYHPDTGNILIVGMNELSVASHEIAHFLDFAYNISTQIMGKTGSSITGKPIYDRATALYRKEITNLYEQYYPGGKRTHSLKKRAVEGFATLLQKFTEQPITIEKLYPNLVRDFLTVGGKFYKPIIGEILVDLRQIVKDYQGLPALDKIGARVTSDLNPTGKDSFLSFWDKVRTQIADDIFPLEPLEQKAGIFRTTQAPSLWMRMYRNSNSLVVNNLQGSRGYWAYKDNGFVKVNDQNWGSLLKKVQKAGNLDTFANYLVARDQYFLWKELGELKKQYIETLDPEIKTSYENIQKQLKNNGFTEQEVTEAYQQNKDRFIEEEKLFDELTREDLKFLATEDVGLVKPEKYEQLTSREGYASLKRQFYDEIVGDEGMQGKGVSKPSILKGRTGSSRAIVNPIFNGMKNHAESIRKGLAQIVKNKIVKLALKNEFPELFQKLQVTTVKDPNTGIITFPQEKDPNIIMGRVNYKRVAILSNNVVTKTVNDVLDFKNVELFEKLLVASNRLFTKGTTGLYPAFAAGNIAVDQITAVAQTQHNYIPIYSAIKELTKTFNSNNPEHRYFQEYMVLGGERQTFVGWQNMSAREVAQKITKEREGLLRILDGAEKGLDILALPSKYSEIMTRATEYIKARQSGKPQIVAIEDAGRVTAPFHHIGKLGGKFGQAVIRSIPFFNPGIQVLDQAIRTLQNPATRARYGFTIAGVTAALVASFGILMATGTEKQKRLYGELDTEELTKYLWYPFPGGEELGKIRIPDQMAVFGTIINMALADQMLNTKYQVGEYVNAGTAFLPQQLDPTDPARALLAWLPQLIKPAVLTAVNKKDFPSIQPIEGEGTLQKPAELRFNKGTSLGAKELGKLLNISPIKIDFLLTGYLGRASGFLTLKPSAINPKSALVREEYFTSGRTIRHYYDLKNKNDAEVSALRNRTKTYSDSERDTIREIYGTTQRISKMLEVYNNLDLEKDKQKAEDYIKKINEELNKLPR